MTAESTIEGILIIPRIKVQNANAISSPMTWGFPAITAFVGLMQALDRKLPESMELMLERVGVICHHFEPQVTEGGYTRAFRLTRNPVGKDGSTSAIAEEGRAHLEISLVFGVAGPALAEGNGELKIIADDVAHILSGMRVAGGSVIPRMKRSNWQHQPSLIRIDESENEWQQQFRKIRRQLLPGFALVSRQDLLEKRLQDMRSEQPDATALDAWLDLSRLHVYPETADGVEEESAESGRKDLNWQVRRPPGWIVPIPVGYGALSDLYPPGQVARARDNSTPFRFVETLYSIGEWVSPHRLKTIDDLLWVSDADPDSGIYQCSNPYGGRRRCA
ncbi:MULTISPECIES: type I-F CRISPR-associated protein Csy2 [Marinobacter]|nr:type I-F CRISPR-associated protein Csy2 [Marinobacter excellens]